MSPVARDESVLLSLMATSKGRFTNRRPVQSAASYVVSDNEGGAVELTRHLLSLGHRRIGFITGPKYARNATERLKGFRHARKRYRTPSCLWQRVTSRSTVAT